MKTFNLSAAVSDISSGLRMRNIWMRLAIDDLRLRYSRTRLGPLWLSLGMAIYIGGMGLVWGTLFRIDLEKFYPYMAIGLVSWQYITATVTEGANSFVGADSIILAIPLPLSIHINFQVLRVMITLVHTLPIAVLVSIFCGVEFSLVQLLIFPSILLFAINAWWITLLLGILGSRFRDVGHIIGTFLPFMFFLTPILWQPDMLRGLAFIAHYNPFTHYIEILRQPLLGQVPSTINYAVVGALTFAGIVTAIVAFARTRHRIAFWL